MSSEFTFSKADQGPLQTGRRDSCGRVSHTNLKRMGVEEKIVVFKLLSQFLSKALFFIDSRVRVVK